jgi:dynein heavy chain 2
VLVGPSGCGKTTIWKTLKKAYEKLNQPVKTYLINPKSMPRSAFLGHMNNDTR